jgi:N-acetylmuramic acid 6-phosphate (MurNAc-6-P) etherase
MAGQAAIVMARRGVEREEADALLAAHAGRLRAVIGDPPPVAP